MVFHCIDMYQSWKFEFLLNFGAYNWHMSFGEQIICISFGHISRSGIAAHAYFSFLSSCNIFICPKSSQRCGFDHICIFGHSSGCIIVSFWFLFCISLINKVTSSPFLQLILFFLCYLLMSIS
jgi:hypothetical protein